ADVTLLDDAALLQPTETRAEDVGGNALRRVEELREPSLVEEEQVTNHEQRPRVAHDVERSCDGARGAEGTCGRGTGGPRHAPTVSRCLHHASDAVIVRGNNHLQPASLCGGGYLMLPAVHALITELEAEAGTTRRVLERVPADRLDWSPHPKSMTTGQLARHIATIPGSI